MAKHKRRSSVRRIKKRNKPVRVSSSRKNNKFLRTITFGLAGKK